MSKKTDDLLAKAKSLDDGSLTDAIEALEFLGDEATANHQEFKDLEALVKRKENEPTTEPTAKEDTVKASDTAAETTEKVAKIAEETKDAANKAALAEKAVDARDKTNLKYADIKMIGNMFYSKKDNYTVGFATADECAAYFN